MIEVWDEKHYKFANWKELQGVNWNCNDHRGKYIIMLTFALIILWLLSILLVI